MDAQGFVAALTPAVTDADARERFLADPKAVLAARGWICRSGSRSVHVKVMQPNSPSPCQPYATLTPTSAMTTSKVWREGLRRCTRSAGYSWWFC